MRIRSAALISPALCLLLLGCALPALAQKTTVDPNSVRKPVDVDVRDARLEKKVTYEAWHTPLKTILEDISESTGVTLSAGYNKKDWQVRDRRMNIFVEDVTLAQLMNSIARVMKFKWSKSEEVDPPTYRLCADRRLLAGLQAEASRLEKELKSEEVKRRTGLVDALAKVACLTGTELEALKEENPYLYMCAETGFARFMAGAFSDDKRLREAFVNANRTAIVKVGTFSPSTQELCGETIRKMWPVDSVTQNRSPVSDTMEKDLPQGDVHFSWLTNPAERSQRKRLFYFGAQLASDNKDLHFLGDLRDPYAESTQAWARDCLNAVEKKLEPGAGWGQLGQTYFAQEMQDAKEIEPYFMLDDVIEHPDDPDLHKTISVKITEEEQKALMEEEEASGRRTYGRLIYQAMLKAVARAAEMNLVSDSYNAVVFGNMSSGVVDGELASILEQVTESFVCNWDKRGNMLEIRRRDWFRRRASQIPDEWIKPWREEVEKKGALSLDSYAGIVVLSEDQIEENITSDPLLSQTIGACWDYGDKRELCRLYQQLSSAQRALLGSEMGLDLTLLDPRQRQTYSDMFTYGWQRRWCSEEFANAGSGKLAMKATTYAEPDGSNCHRFTVRMSGDGDTSAEESWAVVLRKVARQEKAGTGK